MVLIVLDAVLVDVDVDWLLVCVVAVTGVGEAAPEEEADELLEGMVLGLCGDLGDIGTAARNEHAGRSRQRRTSRNQAGRTMKTAEAETVRHRRTDLCPSFCR